jgi:hypothetical protein
MGETARLRTAFRLPAFNFMERPRSGALALLEVSHGKEVSQEEDG